MMIEINDREWREFPLSEIMNSDNSKAYHTDNLLFTETDGLAYITRTANLNGLYGFVTDAKYKINPSNTISFGAETAEFFYQPAKYITGNKMYYMYSDNLSKEIGLFLVTELRKGIKNCFSYANGAIPERVMRKKIMLPVSETGNPDYEFMAQLIAQREEQKKKEYISYCKKQLSFLGSEKRIKELKDKEWKEFFVSEIFMPPKRGKRITSARYIDGDMPVVSSAGGNNGVIAFVGNEKSVRIYEDCLSVANGGVSAGFAFYHPYKFIATDHVTHFKGDGLNKYQYMFLGTVIRNQMHTKYDFSREMTDPRLQREKIIVPVTDEELPDYEYMEQYIKNMLIKKYKAYIEYVGE